MEIRPLHDRVIIKRLAETDAAREQAQYVSRYDADFAREQITFCYAALA